MLKKDWEIREIAEAAAVGIMVLFALLSLLLSRSSVKERVYQLDDGAIQYEGQMANNKFNGQGTVTFANGDVYTGAFVDGRFEGEGKFSSAAGWSYEGDFKKGEADGQGVLISETAAIYRGNFTKGVYQGK
ncbi:hypothetical protein M2139_002741 [Enterococcus sp. PF1-24]|uniref:hypothetical protein n=1 Tax=unclassified Enterococcus TaxID=2608891 RepID=UPI002474E425|nr:MULTISPECIES: hypothetical protein [unclassified Enterococcus]MDH6365712.1 hypothetical protein [Enterococcus sp. PFB1-1]MDH6402812.1 hypothetical protein [Enterococcus sp. PF1-24]